jgi:hypothetical protein
VVEIRGIDEAVLKKSSLCRSVSGIQLMFREGFSEVSSWYVRLSLLNFFCGKGLRPYIM